MKCNLKQNPENASFSGFSVFDPPQIKAKKSRKNGFPGVPFGVLYFFEKKYTEFILHWNAVFYVVIN